MTADNKPQGLTIIDENTPMGKEQWDCVEKRQKPRELSAAELWLNTTGTWEIWIDDVEGELAMEPNELARHKLEVVEYKTFELMSRELDKNHSAYAALEEKYQKAVGALRAAPKGNMSLVYWDKWLARKEQTLIELGE